MVIWGGEKRVRFLNSLAGIQRTIFTFSNRDGREKAGGKQGKCG